MSSSIEILATQPLILIAAFAVCAFFSYALILLVKTRSELLRSSRYAILDFERPGQNPSDGNPEGQARRKAKSSNKPGKTPTGGLVEIGIPLGATEWNSLRLGAFGLLVVLGFFANAPVLGFGAGLCALLASMLWVNSRKGKIQIAFESQVLQLEMQMAENSRAGLSVEKSLRSCQEESEFPLSGHLDRMLTVISYSNYTLTEAFRDFAEHARSNDVNLLASVIAVQQETGANLADTLDFLAEGIANKHRMRQTLRSRLAEMQLTKLMVAFAPVIILAICCGCIQGVTDFYMSNPIGWILLALCILGECVGLYLLNKMSQIAIE